MSELVELFPAAELEEDEIRQAHLPDGTAIAVYNADGEFYATHDMCTHEDASLSEDGEIVDGCIVECGWHMGQFDLKTGKACMSPCNIDIRTYPITLKDGVVYVEV